MALWLTLLIVIAGISGIVLLVHMLGGSHLARLDSQAGVLQMWQSEQPDHKAIGALLEPSAQAALIDLEAGGTGLLWAVGDTVAGRVLTAGSLAENAETLRITLPDFTAPQVEVTIAEPIVRRIWAETLKTVLKESAT